MTFEKFKFSQRQVKSFLTSARKDFAIAQKSDIADVSFRFGYDALIKLAIAVCAAENLKVHSRTGHHIELIDKLASLLAEPDIREFANQMRRKRNMDLYGGGTIISEKEAKYYLKKIKQAFLKADDYLAKKQGKVKLF
jgi:hypothetical protein